MIIGGRRFALELRCTKCETDNVKVANLGLGRINMDHQTLQLELYE